MSLDLTGLGSAFDFAGGLLDRFFPKKMDEEERTAVQAQLASAIDERDAKRDEHKQDIIVSELNQKDAYTKRARPSVVYMGLLFIFLVHVLFPIAFYFAGLFKQTPPELPQLSLPTEFWWAWSGICTTWVLGRSAEKRGASGKLLSMITGSKQK
jgi:hypothetical protein